MKEQVKELDESKDERGSSIIELMVSIVILSVMSLAITQSTIGALRYAKFTESNHVASSLAISKMEEISALDAVDVDTSLNQTESSVTWPSLEYTFTRTTTVTVNADDSRTVVISVTTNNAKMPTTVTFSSSFAVWE